jgi:hypothetical protein
MGAVWAIPLGIAHLLRSRKTDRRRRRFPCNRAFEPYFNGEGASVNDGFTIFVGTVNPPLAAAIAGALARFLDEEKT